MTQSPRTGSSAPSGTDVTPPRAGRPPAGDRSSLDTVADRSPRPDANGAGTKGVGVNGAGSNGANGRAATPAPSGWSPSTTHSGSAAGAGGQAAGSRSAAFVPTYSTGYSAAETGNGSAAPRTGRAGRSRGPRRAQLQLRHINPWTVLKFSAVLSIALFFVWLIVVGVLYGILDGGGVIGSINNTVTTINGPGSSAPITPGVVFGGASIIGVINIVLFIALSTIGSLVYNLCSDLVGGIEVTLSER